jgi:hypothetical protein
MFNLDDFELLEPAGKEAKTKEPYLYVHNSGKLQLSVGALAATKAAPGQKMAFYFKKEGDTTTVVILVDAIKGHLLRGSLDSKNVSFNDADLCGKLLAATIAEKDNAPGVSKIKKIDIPITDLNDQSGKLFKLELASASIILI